MRQACRDAGTPDLARRGAWTAAALLAALFALRTAYGLVAEFWFPDEKQVFLLGLKYSTTLAWPYFGPDVVYTRTQIPGALQALLVGLPLRWVGLPEAPCVALNAMSFAALALLAWYAARRFPRLPRWFVWGWTLTCPWSLVYGTRVVNPSYVLPFAVLFCVGLVETLPVFEERLLRPAGAFFLQGLATGSVLQLHLSWVLLPPLTLAALALSRRDGPAALAARMTSWLGGAALALALVLPTFLRYGLHGSGGVEQNLVLRPEALADAVTILQRFLSFGAFEVTYVLGSSQRERLDFLRAYPWAAPCVAALFVLLVAQVALYAVSLVRPGPGPGARLRNLVVAALALVWMGFLFSVKGPSSHTFYVMFPLALLWAFACTERTIGRWPRVTVALGVLLACGAVVHLALAMDSYARRSLYRDRARVVHAIEARDYRILGLRRADEWGHGY